MITLHLYKHGNGWITTTPEWSHKVPPDAELVLVSSAESKAEAQDKVDRFMGNPPYLEVQEKLRTALHSGLSPSEAVKQVHESLGALPGPVWADHFFEILGTDRHGVSLLFIEWWPDPNHVLGMSNEEFDKRIVKLKNA